MGAITTLDGLPAIAALETTDDPIWGRHFKVEFVNGQEIEFWVGQADIMYDALHYGYTGRKNEIRVIAKRAKQAYDEKYAQPN